MNIAQFWIENRVTTLVLTFVLLGGGMITFGNMGRLEDPEFTIKDALVITPYPGANAREVEEEVTDEIEAAAQQLGQLKELESRSERGLSTVTVTIQDRFDKTSLPQVWDELRRKVGDAQSSLPPGAGPSIVVDDYGDVFGVFVAVTGPEYSYAQLKETVDLLRKELLLVQDVAKIDTFGERTEVIYVELDRDRASQLGISVPRIASELQSRNTVSDAGRVRVTPEYIAIEPTGIVTDVTQFEDIPISGIESNEQIFLRDIATIRRDYLDPPSSLIRYDGTAAIGLGISTVSGGNVVVMGNALEARMQELRSVLPLGIEFGIVSLQSQAVTVAISGFTNSLLQAVGIVIVVLLFFMGLRSGLLIGFVLFLTIAGSFIFLDPMGVALERISLGALIIALGMLVDNAIVVVDGVLVRQARGMDTKQAAIEVVRQSAIPLLGATAVAILAFAAIGTSEDKTGEFCRSLFQVVLVSLSFSWVTAVTVTPLLCVMFLKPPEEAEGEPEDAYAGRFYQGYMGFVRTCIRGRFVVVGLVVAIFAGSLVGFGNVEQSFFPPSTRAQFLVDVWMPRGSHVDETIESVTIAEDYIAGLEGVTHVTALVGKGGLRFLLTYTPEKSDTGYAQLLVDVDDAAKIDALIPAIEEGLAEKLPSALSYAFKFELGPGSNGKIRAQWKGDDPNVLRRLADETTAIFASDPVSKAIRNDWRDRVKLVQPVIAEREANLNGLQRSDVATVLRYSFDGVAVGVFRDGDLLLPIVMRAPEAERSRFDSLRSAQIFSRTAGTAIPLRQIVSSLDTGFEDDVIIREDRKRTITIFADPKHGAASELFGRLRPQVEAIEAPDGYELEWAGEYEDSANAQGPLLAAVPIFVGIMFVVTISLFNSIRQATVIWLNVPLALVGVTVGLLVTGQPFGFMALLGFLSLIGMLIKNGVVLVDEINLNLGNGMEAMEAIVLSGASRLRPVAMAASTTALGMLPLLTDAFFVAMAVTIIFGLLFATVLTMVLIPVFYAILFDVEPSVEPSVEPIGGGTTP
ncbi:MAG: efflux RND transporter permease subunit [Myxococcota bacterium]|nr:efflux RND transporter permease subunit [Myxococcota bacterium]